MAFEYKAENAINVAAAAHEAGRRVTANRYLKRIFFGNDTPFLPQLGRDLPSLPDQWCFQVVLDYGEHDVAAPRPAEDVEWPCRADPFSTYRGRLRGPHVSHLPAGSDLPSVPRRARHRPRAGSFN